MSSINAQKVGIASQLSGAGRITKDDQIDLACGVYLNAQVGDKIEKDGLLATVYGNDEKKLSDAYEELERAFAISMEKPAKTPIIKKIVGLD